MRLPLRLAFAFAAAAAAAAFSTRLDRLSASFSSFFAFASARFADFFPRPFPGVDVDVDVDGDSGEEDATSPVDGVAGVPGTSIAVDVDGDSDGDGDGDDAAADAPSPPTPPFALPRFPARPPFVRAGSAGTGRASIRCPCAMYPFGPYRRLPIAGAAAPPPLHPRLPPRPLARCMYSSSSSR